MSKAARYLKTAWLSRQLELAQPLLPPGAALALWLGGRKLAEIGAAGADLNEASPGALSFPLTLEGEAAGALLLLPPAGGEAQCKSAGDFLAHALQGRLDAEHARRAIAQEALESYREMALLQRAAMDLNGSLKPAVVAAALLKEFDDHKRDADYGAVFLRDAEGKLALMQCFGAGADEAFGRLADSEFFAGIAADASADIVNDLRSVPTVPEIGSLLWRPLIAHGENLGLLVLASQHRGGFTAGDMKRAQTMCSMAAASLHNAQLYAAEQKLFHSFVDVTAATIDAKSRFTAGHCRRVPKIAMLLAEAAHRAEGGSFAQFTLDEDERNAIEIAAKLHDCGKVVTPEWIVDKASKLDSIVNRIDLVALRFELLRRDALMERDRKLAEGVDQDAAERDCRERLGRLDEDFAFLEKSNQGSEFVSQAHIDRIREIAAKSWRDSSGRAFPLLSEDEVYNLVVQRGTLNPKERKIIEDHAAHTIAALEKIAFPRALRNVTDYAGQHHERMDGTGYPRGKDLKPEEFSLPARIIAIADIFEALTAPDRPYRKPNTLNSAIGIMHRMKSDNHIDGELFDLFLSSGVYADYAREHLAGSQIDDVDIGRYLAR
ncbi:MAG TPA: HD domain-containing phosphohydrolase [Rhodocyclaceae bacterium]|nr:HD domain-containing phosphohydrolase [Rhodocyclaceae bacterium]